MKTFTPRPYQKLFADHVLDNKRCAVWAGMGMGKTSGTLDTIDTLSLLDDCRALVLAPLRVAESTWPDEVQKWSNFAGLDVVSITGTPKERIRALNTPAAIHTINYENIPWLIDQGKWDWNTIVADEATRLKSFRLRQGSTRAKALAKVAFGKVDRFIELTGTPSPNGLQDLWGQLWFLDRGERLGRSYSAFMSRWFRPEYPNSFTMVPLPHAQAEIEERVKDICLSLRPQDWFDLKEPVIVDVPVSLPLSAMKLYKQMEKELFFEINNKEIEANNAAAKTMKCLQIANGAIYTTENGSEFEELHSAKIDALESIVAEAAGAPVLVAYHFKSDLARLKKRFSQGKELDQNPQTIKRWNKGEIPILFAHPASAGHGLNLQDGGNIVAFFGHWWDLEQYQQIIERIGPVRQLQAGYNRPVYIYNIRAINTIDSVVIARRQSKRKIQDLLLEAASK